MNERDYYKCRDDNLYTKYTKEEIKELVAKDRSIAMEILQEMDYPLIFDEWERCDYHFGRYIALMRLKGYRGFGWKDSYRFKPPVRTVIDSMKPGVKIGELFPQEKIVLTKREDGDWDCEFECICFDGEKYFPIGFSCVVDKFSLSKTLTFKPDSDGCLYEMKVVGADAVND